jgi:hypothetical protein
MRFLEAILVATLVTAVTSAAVLSRTMMSPEEKLPLEPAPLEDPASTSSRVAPPASGVWLGIGRMDIPDDFRAVQAYERDSGRRFAIYHWYAIWGGWKSAFSRADLEAVAARGALPLITWEPWASHPNDPAWSLRAAILSGAHDAYIASWARGLAAYGRPILLRFAQEMHHQTYPWAVGVNGNTADEYVAAWRHVRAIFQHHGATNVQWVWNPNTLGDKPSSAYDLVYRAVFPGAEFVDWYGLSIFNTGPALDWGAPYWRPLSEIVDPPYQALLRLGPKPILLSEVGTTEIGGDKAAWIADAFGPGLRRFTAVKGIVWFDLDKEQPWHVNSSSRARAAFLDAMRQPTIVEYEGP